MDFGDVHRNNMVKLKQLNFILLIVLLLLLFVLIAIFLHINTALPFDPYRRYLEPVWATSIIERGHFSQNQFPNQSLFSNANAYSINIIPALTISTLHLITGISILQIENMPIYAVPFLLSLAIAAYIMYKKNKIAVIIAILFGCFFLFPVNYEADSPNRIILCYTFFNLMFYALLNKNLWNSLPGVIAGTFIILFFIFTYSTFSITAIPFVFCFCLLESIRLRKFSNMNIAIIFVIVCLTYYFLISNFLTPALQDLRASINNIEFVLPIFRNWANIWPADITYISPPQSYFSLFFSMYAIVSIAILIMITIFFRIKQIAKNRQLTSFDSFWLAFCLVVLFAVLVAPLKIETAGLGIQNLICIFGSIIAVYSVVEIFLWLKRKQFKTYIFNCLVVMTIISGIFGIFYNYYHNEQIQALQVSNQEIQMIRWLGSSNLVVCSDFNFLSAYLAVNGPKSLQFLPMDTTYVNEIYYEADVPTMRSLGIQAFVITQQMKQDLVGQVIGAPTRSVPELEAILSSKLNVQKIFASGENTIFVIN